MSLVGDYVGVGVMLTFQIIGDDVCRKPVRCLTFGKEVSRQKMVQVPTARKLQMGKKKKGHWL